jgi:hypothetical protein
LNEIKLLNEKNASTLAKLDALRTEYDELKARPTFLGACKSCATMHAKLVDDLSTISTLEASLKSPVVNACTSCDEVTLHNLELTSRLDVIYEENDYLRKVLGWLSGQEPQLKIMIEEFKRADGHGLGFEKLGEKVGENSGESVYEKCVESTPEFEVIGDIQLPLPKAPKNSFTPKPNHLCNKLHTAQDPPKFPPKANDFLKSVKFVSEKGVNPREKPEPKPKPIPFRCEYCVKERHLAEFCYKRKRDERLAREQAKQDRYRQPHGIPEPRVPLPRGVGSVRNVGRVGAQGGRFPQGGGGERFDRRDDGVCAGERFGQARGGFAGRPPTRPQYGSRNYGPHFPPRGARTPSMGHGKFGGKGMMFANLSFEQMVRHWFNFLCANPSVESLAHSRSCF